MDQGHTVLLEQNGYALRNARSGDEIEFRARLHIDYEAAALYVAIYLPSCPEILDPEIHVLDAVKAVLKAGSTVSSSCGFRGVDFLSSSDCVFTGRVFLYTENTISADDAKRIKAAGRSHGYSVCVRDLEYVRERASFETPMAFISHDSRDKSDFAAPLALELQKRLCTVWYDEYSLRVGDSLRQGIEKGLQECKKCIFLVTPNFLGNGGWAKREYDSIFTRELVEESEVILPVWIGVGKQDVYRYSPVLADRLAAVWPADTDPLLAAANVAAHLQPAIGS